MQITSKRFPEGISETCPVCTSLGYTTTIITEAGDVTLTQALTNGAVTSLGWQITCPGCLHTFSGTLTIAQLQNQTSSTNPNLLLPIVKATLAGQVYTPPPNGGMI